MIRVSAILLFAATAHAAHAQVIDQKTYDLVVNLASAQARSKGFNLELLQIKSVSILGVDAPVDMSKVEALPDRIEERVFTAINCDDSPQKFKRTLKYETTKSTTLEVSNTVGSTQEFKFGASFIGKYAKFNAEGSDKQTFSATDKSSQTISSKTTEEWPEDREIQPHTILYIKLDIIKGMVRAPLNGTVVFDAEFSGRLWAGNSRAIRLTNESWRLSDQYFAPAPALRTTNFSGYLYGETYDNTKVVYASRKISPDDPECKIEDLQLPDQKGSKVQLFQGEISK